MGGTGLGGEDELLQTGLESGQVADDVQAHALLFQLADFAFQRLHEQAHQQGHFFGGTAPVLGTEGEQGQVAHAGPAAGLDHAAHRLHPLGVPCGTRRPSAVAVHDDGHVLRDVADIGNRLGRTGCHGFGGG